MILKLRNGKNLKITEISGMVGVTLLSKENEVENYVLVSGDYIAGMIFDLERK